MISTRRHSGVPQGSIVGPILSNILLDQLDKHVEHVLIPANNRGKRRRTNPKYLRLTVQVSMMRKQGNWDQAKRLRQLVQSMPSKDPCDLNYRRLWYVRYADDFLVGFAGPKNEAEQVKNEIARFLNEELKLMLNEDKTFITHACDSKANFLGYEIHVLHADDKYDHRTQRCINGSVGLRVPHKIKQKKCSEYMRCGKPIHLPQRTVDTAYSIVAQYQSELIGVVQYYKMAYNLHTLSYLRYVMEVSLLKTLASKYKTTCRKIYRKFGTVIENDEGEKRKVIQVKVNHLSPKIPLITHFGAVSLKWNKWISVNDNVIPIWNKRSEVIQRLLAQTCELCKSQEQIEVHHVRKLADLRSKNNTKLPEWKKRMIERQRKTLVVCHECHKKIQYGKYDGDSLKCKDYRRAT